MSVPAQRSATYEDLCQVPDHMVAQIIHGQLITLPRPASRHARASSIMGGKLVTCFDEGIGGTGGWWILDEPCVHLHPHILAPDLAGCRRERMPSLPEAAFFELPPDWICEVLSPSTQRMDRAASCYAFSGVGVGQVGRSRGQDIGGFQPQCRPLAA